MLKILKIIVFVKFIIILNIFQIYNLNLSQKIDLISVVILEIGPNFDPFVQIFPIY